jgi:N,N-dimethylformamidase beta subunit-like protein
MLKAYCQPRSPFPGEDLVLYVSTNSTRFRLEFYRQGLNLEGPLNRFNNPDIYNGQFMPDRGCEDNWEFASYPITIPPDWASGVYIAMFAELDNDGNEIPGQGLDRSTANGPDHKALFVLRAAPGQEKQIVFKLPTATYQAYNYTGNGSTYRGGFHIASLLRPGNGTGGITTFAMEGTPYQQVDVYDTSSNRMDFVHLEARFIHWIELNGYEANVDYCTDFDLHFNPGILNNYLLLISPGHDEYWSESMRYNSVIFLRQGGNIAFFSGNTCFKHITFLNDWQFTNDGTWADNQLEVEDSFTGVSYRHANGRWDGPREVVGYMLQHKDHWVLENVQDNVIGDVYNNDPNQPAGLVGYECDGAPATMQNGLMVPNGPPTPANFLILGYALLDHSWQDNSDADIATMGIYTDNGNAFTVGTVDWARVLDSGLAPDVEQITRNVFNRLGFVPFSAVQISQIDDIICVDSFYSDDDSFRHVIAGTNNGDITEIFYNPQQGQGRVIFSNQNGLVDLGCFYTPDDKFRHVIAALDNGEIHEIFFNPETGVGDALLGNYAGAICAGGFYSDDDNYRHAIIATTAGDIIEIYYHPQFGRGQTLILNMDGIIDIGCFYSDDDQYRHIIVGTSDGNITEIYYHPKFGISSTVVTQISGIVRLSAFYIKNNSDFNRRVLVLTQSNSIYEIYYSPQKGIMKCLLLYANNVVELSGFVSADDNFIHCILAYSDGRIEEVYYKHQNQ